MSSSKIYAETHQIAAGQQFTGEVPVTDQDLSDGNLIYTPGAKGGLFLMPPARNDQTHEVIAPTTHKHLRMVKSIFIVFGGQTSWTLKIVDPKGNKATWKSGTNETSLVVTDELEFSPGDKMELITLGASTAMIATVRYIISGQL